MREYKNYDEACEDRDLDLKILWECDECGDQRTDYPGCNEGGQCRCGGYYYKAGETYNG